MTNVSFVPSAKHPSELAVSFPKMRTFSVPIAMKRNLPPDAVNVKRLNKIFFGKINFAI